MSLHYGCDDMDGLTVVDVYDIAASLGRDFESIINTYGVESIAELMPKIINVLEHLEVLVSRNQKDNAEINELRYSVERLHAEKKTKAEDRQKYEKEIEQIEEQWRSEVKLLEQEVTKLQDDGRKLRTSLQQHQSDALDASLELSKENELEKQVAELKTTVREQKDRIRSLQRELKQRNVDVEALESQLQHLARVNADFRRKTSASHRHSEQLTQEKRLLENKLYDKELLIAEMKSKLLERDKEERSSPESQTSDEDERICKRKTSPRDGDLTVDDLREALEQRNDIRLKLLEVEEELKQAIPKPDEQDEVFDAPVQGPINREPDDKLYPNKSESGIRKLFQRFLDKLNFERESPQ